MTSFVKVDYDRIQATDTFHNVPRFGHSDNVGLLFADDSDDVSGYVQGLLFGGLFILGCFLLWSLALIVFKYWLKKERVGFLSGAPFRPGTSAKLVFALRIIFASAALMLIAFAFLMHALGAMHWQTTENTIENTNKDVGKILQDTKTLTLAMRALGKTGNELRNALVQFFSDKRSFCPDYPGFANEPGFDFDRSTQYSLKDLDNLGDFIDGDLVELLDAIDGAQVTVNDIDECLEDSQSYWISFGVAMFFVLVTTWMLWTMLFSWFHVSGCRCATVWLGLPLFVLVTVLAYLICSGAMISVVMNADFCAGGDSKSPDASVLQILDASGFEKDEITYEALHLYTSQCDAPDAWGFIRDFSQDLKDARATMKQAYQGLEAASVARLDLVCGREFAPLMGLLELFDKNLQALDDHAQKALEVLACERIAPLYSSVVYEGTCDYSMQSMTWTISSSLIVAFAGMVMLTVRSVLWEYDETATAPARPTKGHESNPEVHKEQERPLSEESETEAHDIHHEL